MPKIFFTGGGTAGHVTPNIAVIRELSQILRLAMSERVLVSKKS